MITDPFQIAATPEPQADTNRNAHALADLSRELGEMWDMDAIRAHVASRNSSRRYDAPAVDVQQEIAEARRNGPCAVWGELDALAFQRAGVAVVAADGRGEGVTAEEARDLSSREPEAVARAARRIVARLADPAIDGLILERAEATASFLPHADG